MKSIKVTLISDGPVRPQEPMKNILLIALGYYGRGSTVTEAYTNIKKAGCPSDSVVVMQVGSTELKFIDMMTVEGHVAFAMKFPKLSCLKGAEKV